MKHPEEKAQRQQDEFLSKCAPNERESHAQLFRIGNAAYVYHQMAYAANDETLKIYYSEWLEGLPTAIMESIKREGFENCKNALPFTRYVNERRDAGMDEWMREHLTEGDYREYKSQ